MEEAPRKILQGVFTAVSVGVEGAPSPSTLALCIFNVCVNVNGEKEWADGTSNFIIEPMKQLGCFRIKPEYSTSKLLAGSRYKSIVHWMVLLSGQVRYLTNIQFHVVGRTPETQQAVPKLVTFEFRSCKIYDPHTTESTPSILPPQPQFHEEDMAIQELWLADFQPSSTMEEANIVAEILLGPQEDGSEKEDPSRKRPRQEQHESNEMPTLFDSFSISLDAGSPLMLLREKADAGDAEAQFYVGRCLELGQGVGVNRAAAKGYFELAADQGHATALLYLASYFWEGKGPEGVNKQRAVHYFQLAADQGDKDALHNMAIFYAQGWEGMPQDHKMAVECFRKAAAKDHAGALYNIGLCYYDATGVEQDFGQALGFFKRAAELGVAGAIGMIGKMYLKGDGVDQDEVRGIEFLSRAADMEDVPSIFNMGLCYEQGRGVEQNRNKAILYYNKAAQSGYPEALLNLGVISEASEETRLAAVQYYFLAAQAGNLLARRNLGRVFLYGIGVEKNPQEAVKWLQKPALSGDIKALALLHEASMLLNKY